jgi:hypothetical protein
MADKDANSLMRAQEGQRRAYGVDYKQQREKAAEDEATTRRRHELARSILNMVDKAKGILAQGGDAGEGAHNEPISTSMAQQRSIRSGSIPADGEVGDPSGSCPQTGAKLGGIDHELRWPE